MKPIKSLHINYFKFFADNAPIGIDGKHLLIYGENGSGKSSIYWALYTLLETVYKTNDEINRYFTKNDSGSLLNLHSPELNSSFVKVELVDGPIYQIGFDDFRIRGNINAEATLRGSDFINYRFMLRISDYRHRDEIDLFELFEKEVFPYVQTRNAFSLIHASKVSNDFNEIWSDLQKGPAIQNAHTRKDDSVHGNFTANAAAPSATASNSPLRTEQLNRLRKEFADKLRAFVAEINVLTQEINVIGNGILRDDLGYTNIRFEVNCVQKFEILGGRGELAGVESDIPVGSHPLITLEIPDYDGFLIPKPQSFLNEAKLTAIGIAIRFSILARRADYSRNADFQLLVLDDLLISLDMSNRQKVLDMLLRKYCDMYQLIILTHDRSFYHYAERKVRIEYGKDAEWNFFEMYEDSLSINAKPYIGLQDNRLKKAEDFFNEHDYPACGLYLRKECERILSELLPDKFKFNVTQDKGTIEKNLNDKINSLREFCEHEEINYDRFAPLKIYKDVILNTLAHNDMESPLYKSELRVLIDLLKDLDKIKRGRSILKSGKNIVLTLTNEQDGKSLMLSIDTREPFVLLEEGDLPLRLSNFGKCELKKVNAGEGWIDETKGYDDIKTLVAEYKNSLNISTDIDLLSQIKYRGVSLAEKVQNAEVE